MLLAWGLSFHRDKVVLRPVIWGMVLQVVCLVLALGVPAWGWSGPLQPIMSLINRFIIMLLSCASKGGELVFGSLVEESKLGFIFAVQVLPAIVFFSALISVAYHLHLLQPIVRVLSFVMKRLMGTSGAESLGVAVNVFLGPTEALLMVRPYFQRMTSSEIMALMVGVGRPRLPRACWLFM